jgi:hypothetical protein
VLFFLDYAITTLYSGNMARNPDTGEKAADPNAVLQVNEPPNERDNKGRFAKGNQLHKRVVRKIPVWFAEKGEVAMRLLVGAATGDFEGCTEYQVQACLDMGAKEKLHAAEIVVERVFGKVRHHQIDDEAPVPSKEEIAARAEEKLWQIASEGDTKALALILQANDPRYAPANREIKSSESVDTVDFAPIITQ